MNSSGELYLVLSNVAIIPAIVLAVFEELYDLASLFASLATVSTLYHLCQSDFYCIFISDIKGEQKYRLMQLMDEFLVSITIIWLVMFFLEIRKKIAISFLFLYIPVFLVTLLGDYSNTLLILGISITILIVSAVICAVIENNGLHISIKATIIAVILMAVGFAIFYIGGDPGITSQYNSFHGTWHVLLLMSMYFIIKIKYGKIDLKVDLNGIMKVKQKEKDFIV